MTDESGQVTKQNPLVVSPDAICPSCERFIGPVDTCPYCGTDSAKSPVLRRLRVVAVLLMVVGLGYLYVSARFRETPVIPIGAITPTMNFAVVRVSGVVPRSAYVGEEDGITNYLSFPLADASGEIQVRAYREVADGVARLGLIPGRNDRVEVEGSLKVTGDRERGCKLHLAIPRNLRILERAARETFPERGRGGERRKRPTGVAAP